MHTKFPTRIMKKYIQWSHGLSPRNTPSTLLNSASAVNPDKASLTSDPKENECRRNPIFCRRKRKRIFRITSPGYLNTTDDFSLARLKLWAVRPKSAPTYHQKKT